MPRFDGTGPFGKGPMTGRGEGYCVLRMSGQDANHPDGFAGLQGDSVGRTGQVLERSGEEAAGRPVSEVTNPAEAKTATVMTTRPCSDITAPIYMGCAGLRGGHCSPGTAPIVPRVLTSGDHRLAYVAPYGRWVHPLLRRGFGLHLGGGFGRNRLVRRGRLVC